MKSIALKMTAFLLLSSCAVGPRIDQMIAPQKPHGVSVILEIRQPDRPERLKQEGELIEVRDSGVVILAATETGAQLAFVAWVDIIRVMATELKGFRSIRISDGEPSAKNIDEISIVSRYPQGLSQALMSRLLVFYDQKDLLPIPREP